MDAARFGRLSERLKRGDKELYTHFAKKIFAAGATGDRAIAEEIADEMMIKLWNGAARFGRSPVPIAGSIP